MAATVKSRPGTGTSPTRRPQLQRGKGPRSPALSPPRAREAPTEPPLPRRARSPIPFSRIPAPAGATAGAAGGAGDGAGRAEVRGRRRHDGPSLSTARHRPKSAWCRRRPSRAASVQQVPRDPRAACHGHRGANDGIEHPVSDGNNHARRTHDAQKSTRRSLRYAPDDDLAAKIGMPAVMDFQLLPDMGRMNG